MKIAIIWTMEDIQRYLFGVADVKTIRNFENDIFICLARPVDCFKICLKEQEHSRAAKSSESQMSK